MTELQPLPEHVFALVDCDNFFVSCERLFRPELEGRAVVVLSSNDGCVVARSNESKALGIPMGAPAFKYRQFFKDQSVVQFSANFELYGDISRRIIAILTRTVPQTEVYSVDESFLDLSGIDIIDYAQWGKNLRQNVFRAVGVPVSIGIATTKTLAKLGSDYAKRNHDLGGAVDLVRITNTAYQAFLNNFPVEKVWGVGRRLAPKLRAEGINNALDLSRLRPRQARQLMGLMGLQMVSELSGLSCYGFNPQRNQHQTIMRSRTFGEDTNQFEVLEAAIVSLTTQAAWQVRSERQLARRASFFLSSNKHKPGYASWHETINLVMPTNDSGRIIGPVLECLNKIYTSRQLYHRAGITIYDFIPEESLQIDLLGEIRPDIHDDSSARMSAVDTINKQYGRHHIYYAAEDLSQSWQPKHYLRSPRYVSRWEELPETTITT
jgi:DNA polymerase V